MEYPLRFLVENWLLQLKAASRKKEEEFGKYAREAYQFFNGPPDFMWEEAKHKKFTDEFGVAIEGMLPDFRIQVNRLMDLVTLFGPSLVHKYPDFDIRPLIPPSPFDEIEDEELEQLAQTDPETAQQIMTERQSAERRTYCARVLSHWLNWLQQEGDKKGQLRLVITETLIKGMGLLMTEVAQPPGSAIAFPQSYFVNVDDYLVDPDARKRDSINWIAIRRRETVADVLEKFPDLTKEQLKGQFQSINSQQSDIAKREKRENRGGESFDILEYWEIYSKQGFGDEIKGPTTNPKPTVDTSGLGKFCRIVVAEGIHFPLNLPPQAMSAETGEEEILQRVAWPAPYYFDRSWPVEPLTFIDDPNSVWPPSIGRNAVGLLRFMNWILSFMADKVAVSCRDILGIVKGAMSDLENQVEKKRFGPFMTVLIDKIHGSKISDVLSYIEGPQFKADLWKVYAECVEMFEKITGLTDLAYGISNVGIRSASEFEGRNQRVDIRTDDMAAKVEDFCEHVATKEALCILTTGQGKDLAPVVGEYGAVALLEYVAEVGQEAIVRDFAFKIVAGSARKPNKDQEKQETQQLTSVLAPVFQQAAVSGDVGPMNWLIERICKAYEWDSKGALLSDPTGGMDPAAIQAQQAQMQAQADAEIKAQQQAVDSQIQMEDHAQEMVQAADEHSQQMRFDEEEHRLKIKHQGELLALAKKKAALAAKKPPARSGSSSGRAKVSANGKARRS